MKQQSRKLSNGPVWVFRVDARIACPVHVFFKEDQNLLSIHWMLLLLPAGELVNPQIPIPMKSAVQFKEVLALRGNVECVLLCDPVNKVGPSARPKKKRL